MLCTKCGHAVEEGAAICPACGAEAGTMVQEMPAIAVAEATGQEVEEPAELAQRQEALHQYVEMISGRLLQKPQFIPDLRSYMFKTDRMTMALAKLHQYFFITQNDGADYESMRQFTEACVAYVLDTYKGLPRGLQKGLGIYPVMCQYAADPQAIAFAQRKPDNHFAAFELPVVVEMCSGRLYYMQKTPVWGFAMWKGIKRIAENTLSIK